MMSRHLMGKALTSLKDEVSTLLTRSLYGKERELASSRLKHLFEYTMSDGKNSRSCLALDTFKALRPNAPDKDLFTVAKVSASLELLQTFFLIIDDVMDSSLMRRGKPSWHTLPKIGMNAINDGLALDSSIALVIRNEIPHHPKLQFLLHDISETRAKTVMGQMLDAATLGVDDCTWDRYDQLVSHKTSHYTYYLPIAVGFHLADKMEHTELMPLTYRLGYLFQAQDDFLDCFGDSSVTGKSSTDIGEGKCTWLACTALDLIRDSKPNLMQPFRDNFGSRDPQKVMAVLQIMQELEIAKIFEYFEQKEAAHIRKMLQNVEVVGVRDILTDALNKIIGRKK